MWTEGTMVDTWATVGSCAQIGKNVHLSGGVGIGGVLEPMQAGPTIIEDNCFIGARSEVVEGCIVREGSVLGMGVYIGQSTKIVDRETGEVMYGEVPAYSVVVSGSMPSKNGVNLYCAVIVKRVDEKTRSKTSINEPDSRSLPETRHARFLVLLAIFFAGGLSLVRLSLTGPDRSAEIVPRNAPMAPRCALPPIAARRIC
jgi:carbonic anhydrase/acetyltransferase-like protein (isoleucine patch superfamily)